MLPVTNVQAASFSDVTLYHDEINYLVDREILTGYENGTFKPDSPMNRLNGVQVLLRAKGITNFDAPNPNFTDMKPGAYGYAEVAKAVQLGMISGKTRTDGTKYFDPSAPLTRGQMAKIIVETMEYPIDSSYTFRDVPKTNDFYKYISTLAVEGVTEGYEDNTFKSALPISRQHFAVFIARTLNDDFKPEPKPTSFLMNPKYDYVHTVYRDGQSYLEELNYIGPDYYIDLKWHQWRHTSPRGQYTSILYEDKERLLTGIPDSEYYLDLKYPIYKGKVFDDGWDTQFKVVNVGLTYTTKAGTFNQVVEVKDSGGYTIYYAPNIGAIKTIHNGRTTMELTELNLAD